MSSDKLSQEAQRGDKRGPASRSSVTAAIIGIVLLVIGAIVYRMASAEYQRASDSVPLAPGTLARLTMQIADWSGVDVPLDQAIIKATNADQVVNRRYTKPGGETVALFIAYGIRTRDLMPHRPEVCYPTHGWSFVDAEPFTADHTGTSDLQGRLLRFQRTGFATRRITVLNYYIVDGQYAPDVSLLRSRIWQPTGGARYMLQVQITCTDGAVRSPAEAVREFAVASAADIRSLLPDKPAVADPHEK